MDEMTVGNVTLRRCPSCFGFGKTFVWNEEKGGMVRKDCPDCVCGIQLLHTDTEEDDRQQPQYRKAIAQRWTELNNEAHK